MTQSSSSIDTILLPSGPLADDWRAPCAALLYHRARPASLIVSGNYTGILDWYRPSKRPARPDAVELAERLVHFGVPERIIRVEPEALDTVENMVLAKPHLDAASARNVGLITDDYHMERCLWLAKRILPQYQFFPCRTGKAGSRMERMMESLLRYALKQELHGLYLHEEFQQYLRKSHPFRAPKCGNHPPLGPYRRLVEARGLLCRLGI